MNLPSLGYEDDTILSKSQAAQIQLPEAISLFLVCKFLPAITLAGAAEEILGKLLHNKAQMSIIKESIKTIEILQQHTNVAVMNGKPEKEIVNDWNAARNLLKHLVGAEDEPIVLNLCDEAYWIIRRALANAQKLEIPISNSQEFESWVIIKINT